MNTANKTQRFPWKALLCSCLFLGAGQGILVNCVGLFIQPVCKALNFETGPFSLQLSLGALAMMVSFALAEKVIKKFPTRPLLLFCVIVQATIFVLYSQFTQLWMFYLAHTINGFVSVIPAFIIGPLLISNWFEKKRGLVMGIAMGCVGIFGAIFSILGGNLIFTLGYKAAYIILGSIAAVLLLAAVFICELHPSVKNKEAYGAEQTGNAQNSSGAGLNTGISKKQAIRSASFLMMFFTVFVIVCAGAFAPQLSVLSLSKGFGIQQAGVFSSMFMIGCLVGSFVLGWLNDKIGVKNCTMVSLSIGAIAAIVIVLSNKNAVLYSSGLMLFGIACSAAGVQPPLVVSVLFGKMDYVAIYGIIQIALSLGGVIATPVYGFVYDFSGNFNTALIAVGFGLLICIPLTVLAFKLKPKAEGGKIGIGRT